MQKLHINPTRLQQGRRQYTGYDKSLSGAAYFAMAMNTELEHGKASSFTNVTDDSAMETAKIVVAHLYGVEKGGIRSDNFPASRALSQEIDRSIMNQRFIKGCVMIFSVSNSRNAGG